MQRIRTWEMVPAELRVRNRTLPVDGGDGSTLSLDFTAMGGTLDSRLTFTRSSTATFINSLGYVQYADANLVLNSTMLVSTVWTPTTSGGGTVTINNDNTVTFASTAGRATWLQTITIQSGLPVTFSIEVTALTNTNIRVSDLFQAGSGFTSQVYNYTDLSGNTTAGIGAFTTLPGIGLYTVNATTTATSGNVVFGTDSNGVTRTGSVTIARPQLQYGTRVSSRVYLANSSTSAANTNTPRFDYDPTTLAPRGLLIEGSATNLLPFSNTLQGGTWFVGGNGSGGTVTITNPYTATNPANGSTSTRLQFAVADVGGSPRLYYITSQTLPYTMSLWMKSNTAGNHTISIYQNDTWVNFTVTPTWQRFQATRTSGSALLGFFMIGNNSTSLTPDILVYGAQLEAGSGGASSYIPTGTSTVQRAADSCVMSGTNFSSWFNATQGTLLTTWSGTGVTSGRYATINDGSASNQIWTGFSESAIYNGSFQASFGVAATANEKVALAYLLNDAAWCLNGGAVSTDTSVTLPTGLNQICIGNSQAGTAAIGTALRTVKYFPLRLPNAQLQAITT